MLPPSMVGLPYFREEIDGEFKSKLSHHRQLDLFVPQLLAFIRRKGKRQIVFFS